MHNDHQYEFGESKTSHMCHFSMNLHESILSYVPDARLFQDRLKLKQHHHENADGGHKRLCATSTRKCSCPCVIIHSFASYRRERGPPIKNRIYYHNLPFAPSLLFLFRIYFRLRCSDVSSLGKILIFFVR